MRNKKKKTRNRRIISTASIVLAIACFVLLYAPISESLFGSPASRTASPSENNVQIVTLQGSSEHWAAQYTQEARSESNFDNESKTTVVFKYKGDSPETAGQISYLLQSDSREISGTGTLFEDGTMKTGTEGMNIALLSKDSIVKVEIKWNDKSESFELRN